MAELWSAGPDYQALLQVLQDLINLLGIPSSLNFAVMGAVILIGVIADQLFKRRSAPGYPLTRLSILSGGCPTYDSGFL